MPITGPAGLAGAEPRDAIAGVLKILRNGAGPEASGKWASSCVLSGECIKVCDYGVNPRFLLTMARVAMARTKNEPRQRRKLGLDSFRLVARDVVQLSRIQLTQPQLARLAGEAMLNDQPLPLVGRLSPQFVQIGVVGIQLDRLGDIGSCAVMHARLLVSARTFIVRGVHLRIEFDRR